MIKANDIKCIWDLVGSVETFTLQTYQDTLRLSDGLKAFEENSPNKPPFAINYLEYYNSHEPVTSWIIRHIFAYSYNGHHPYFESFAETFLQRIGFSMDWIDTPIIDKDHEYKSIDILVRDKQYAVIIENKLKGADFQLNQLARYIATMRNEGYRDDQIFVVVLPKDDIDNDYLWDSVWKLPTDWRSTSLTRKCRVDDHTCWCDCEGYAPKAHCSKCEPLKQLYEERTLFIHKELSDWLFDCFANNVVGLPDEEVNKQYVLKSASLQFVDFLNYLYQTRENDKYKMGIQKFLIEQLKLNDRDMLDQLSLVEDKMNDTNELLQKLDSLYKSKLKSYITEIGNKYQIHIMREEYNDGYDYCSYEISIDGKTIMVSLGYETEYFCQIESKGRGRIPEIVKNDFDIAEELNDKDNRNDCIWKYDSYKESLLRFDRVLGRLLDIQKTNHSL